MNFPLVNYFLLPNQKIPSKNPRISNCGAMCNHGDPALAGPGWSTKLREGQEGLGPRCTPSYKLLKLLNQWFITFYYMVNGE